MDIYVEDLTEDLNKCQQISRHPSKSEPKISSRKMNKNNTLDGDKIFKKLMEFRNRYSGKKNKE